MKEDRWVRTAFAAFCAAIGLTAIALYAEAMQFAVASSEYLLGAVGVLLGGVSLVFLFLFELARRPSIEFLDYHDEVTAEDIKQGHRWFHGKVRNRNPRWPFNRDAALSCIVRVEFLDPDTMEPLAGVSQIEAHWTNNAEPRSILGVFVGALVPACQRLDVGFREEMFDVVIKCDRESGFYAANPWEVYKDKTAWSRVKIERSTCRLRVEVEAINLGRRQTALYTLQNRGSRLEDLRISKDPES